MPFHGPAALPERAGPRLLLLSYLFPPNPAVGALRWQKFARHVAAAGLGLDVIALDPDQIASPDRARLADLPEGIRVFAARQPALSSERIEQSLLSLRNRLRRRRAGSAAPVVAPPPGPSRPRIGSYSRGEILNERAAGGLLRAYHAWQDIARGEAWAGAAATMGRRIFAPGVHRAVISCGPPHPVHLGAAGLARRAGLPLVIDLRDPWALVERLPEHIASPHWYRLSSRMERQVVREAALTVLNTEAAASAMRDRYPGRAGSIICIMNGCDDEVIPAAARDRFLVAYTGSIYLDRDPRPLFQAARRVVTRLNLTPDRFGIEFMGNVHTYQGQSLGAMAAQEGMDPFVRVHAARPRAEALAFLAGASLLLSLPQDSEMAVPSKLFEYFQFPAWVLALAEGTSATGVLLQGTDADAVSPRDIEGIVRVLERRILSWQRGEIPEALATQERFTRRFQARHLLEAILPLLGPVDSQPAMVT